MNELIELGLRPAVAAEQALIEALKAEGGPELRGGITELLKACIRRGYAVLTEHAASGDADVAAHGDFESAGGYRFKLLDVYLQATADRPRSQEPRQERSEEVRTSMASAEQPSAAAAPLVTVEAPLLKADPEPEPAAPRRRDWTRFKGIAGHAPLQEPK